MLYLKTSHDAIFQPRLHTMLFFCKNFTPCYILTKTSPNAFNQPRLHSMQYFSWDFTWWCSCHRRCHHCYCCCCCHLPDDDKIITPMTMWYWWFYWQFDAIMMIAVLMTIFSNKRFPLASLASSKDSLYNSKSMWYLDFVWTFLFDLILKQHVIPWICLGCLIWFETACDTLNGEHWTNTDKVNTFIGCIITKRQHHHQ